MSSDLTIGKEQTQRPRIVYEDSYFWSCEVCGWLGTGLSSLLGAQAEGAQHIVSNHPEKDTAVVEVRSAGASKPEATP